MIDGTHGGGILPPTGGKPALIPAEQDRGNMTGLLNQRVNQLGPQEMSTLLQDASTPILLEILAKLMPEQAGLMYELAGMVQQRPVMAETNTKMDDAQFQQALGRNPVERGGPPAGRQNFSQMTV